MVMPEAPAGVRVSAKEDGTRVEVRAVLPPMLAAKLAAGKMSQEDGEALLQFHLINDGKLGPAMFGAYERRGTELVFVPRFPLQPDKVYRARFTPPGEALAAIEYKVPPRPPAPAAEVVAVWPTDDLLPANHLRFYIQFSRPMRGGEDIFQQLSLLDADGKEVTDPWLPDELWGQEGTLLILYIHPGRIKWGVLLRMLLGPVLEPDRTYTLVISGDMLDADGRKLAKEYRKKIRTSAEDRTRIELSAWKIHSPKVGSQAALVAEFPKALDHLGLERYLKVTDAKGQPIAGKALAARDGRSWKFVPEQAWTAQDYRIAVDERLEDVAGNTPVRPFDVDADAPTPLPQRLDVVFRPK
jgi:hypothetical protein